MTLEGSGGSELTQLMADHIFSYIYRNVLLTVMNGNGVTDEFREYGGCARPGLEYVLGAVLIHGTDARVELFFYLRCFFQTSAHVIFPPYLAFLRFTMNLSVRAFLLRVL